MLRHFRFLLCLLKDSRKFYPHALPPSWPQGMCKRIHGHPVHMLRSCCGQVHSLLLDLLVPLRFLRRGSLPLPSGISLSKDVKYSLSLHLFLLLQEDGFRQGYPDFHLPQQRSLSFPSAFQLNESTNLLHKQLGQQDLHQYLHSLPFHPSLPQHHEVQAEVQPTDTS